MAVFCNICNKKGMCEHYWSNLRAKSAAKAAKKRYENPSSPRKTIAKISKSKKESAEKIAQKKELNIFFADQILQIPRCCENCGEPFGYVPPWQRKWLVAHILPKSTFESVATHPMNRMFLCVMTDNNCHDNYDRRGRDHRRNMPVYKLAIERLQHFKDQLTDHEEVLMEKYL